MTVIAWDGCTLAADKLSSCNGIKNTVTKIGRFVSGPFPGAIYGYAGSLDGARLLIKWIELGADPETWPASQKTDSWVMVLIITKHGKIKTLEREPVFLDFENTYMAIGSGAEYARGAMQVGASAKEAVEATCAICASCGMGVDVLHLKA